MAQVMLAWNRFATFSCFFYPAGGLQWGNSSTMNGVAAAQVQRRRWSKPGIPACV
jgi:hypothetical protein